MSSPYFLKPEYVENPVVSTHDDHSGGVYWTRSKIYSASYYQWPVYKFAARLLQKNGWESCVDVGCGVGIKLQWLHRRLPQLRIAAIDQRSAIEYCKSAYDFGEWHADDFESPDRDLRLQAPLVICADVIEHVRNPDVLLSYLRERCAAGGQILLSTPDRDALRGADCVDCPNKYHVREWNFREFAAYVESRGLRIIEHFHQLPVRVGFNLISYNEILRRKWAGQVLRYNQVCLVNPS